MFEYAAGLAMGSANAVRHRLRGYRTPRPAGIDARPHAAKIVARWCEQIDPSGKRILEVGPGSELLTGELLLARGAVSYVAVDMFPLAAPNSLGYVVTSFPHLPDLDGEYDLIVSNATLEHIDDVPATFLRLAELTAHGGCWCHYVDAKTHMRWLKDRDPLNLLRYPDWLYKGMSFPGVPNRLRAGDYVRAAASAGFATTIVPGKTADPAYLATLPARIRGRDDLGLLSFMLVCHR